MEKSLKKLSEHLYCLPYYQESDRPNLYYIKGRDYSLAIDAGNSKRHVDLFYDAIKIMGFELPKYTIISHWHWDHTFGLPYISGKSIASRKTYQKLLEVKQWSWTISDMDDREKTGEDIAFCNEHIVVEYPDLSEIKVVLPEIILDDNYIFDLGDITVELIVRDSTHSRDSIFVYIPNDSSLIVQDADCEDFYHGAVYDKKRLVNMIEFFQSIQYDKHYLGHADVESKEFAINRLKQELEKL